MSERITAAAAMRKAEQVAAAQESHEEICAVRYRSIDRSITLILRLLSWGGVAAFSIIVGLLGWSLQQQYQSQLQARAEATAKIEMLERQLQQSSK